MFWILCHALDHWEPVVVAILQVFGGAPAVLGCALDLANHTSSCDIPHLMMLAWMSFSENIVNSSTDIAQSAGCGVYGFVIVADIAIVGGTAGQKFQDIAGNVKGIGKGIGNVVSGFVDGFTRSYRGRHLVLDFLDTQR